MQFLFVRFLLVGIINTAVGLSCIFAFLNLFHMNYWLATWFGNCIGLFVSYFLNRRFTFENREKIHKTLWKFIFVFLVSYTFSYWAGLHLAIYVGMFLLKLPSYYHSDFAVVFGACLYTVTNYIGHQVFTFKTKAIKRNSPKMI